ncbi:MAG: RDD family protein [Planctomycetota bacterium]
MPVKVRCECGAGLTVPDAARGKRVKCKKCGSPVAVPKGPRRKKATRPKADVHDDDFFHQLDLGEAEHDDHRICPKCAAEVSDEDIECPSCGVNLETGQLSAKQKKKRKHGGPDPDLYYKAAWQDSWAFFKKNIGVGIRLGVFWSIFMTLYFASVFMIFYCEKVPLKIFWTGLATVFALGSAGCFWQLWIEIIKATIDGKDSLHRFQFDFFGDVALGLKAIIWPYVLMLPVVSVFSVVVAATSGFKPDPNNPIAIIGGTLIYLAGLFTLPVAMCHLAAKHTWKAYIPYHMFRIAFKNFAPVAWWWLIAITVSLITLVTAGALGYFYPRLMEFFITGLFQLIELCGVQTEEAARGFLFGLLAAGFGMVMIYLSCVLAAILFCLPTFFMMRPTGLLAYYFARDLDTSFKVVANEPAQFWVRYLAYLVDITVINAVGVVLGGALIVLRLGLLSIEMDWIPEQVNHAPGLFSFVFSIVYFVMGESGPGRATMGMKALGLTVVNEDGTFPITAGSAMVRYFGRIIGAVPLGIGLLMCAFDKEKKTLHDKLTKTKVVWKGEVH